MPKATIKMIAEAAGVSRGTVDRVLNNRPYVKKDIAERVRRVAEELHYTPNAAAKALKTKRELKIAAVLPPRDERFFVEVENGIKSAQTEYEEYGIAVERLFMREYTIEEQMRLMEQVEKKRYDGVVFAPFDALAVKRVAKRLAAAGVPLVTFHSNIDGVKTVCFVGQDNIACGRVAGQLLSFLLDGRGRVFASLGRRNRRSNIQREEGLRAYMGACAPDIAVEEGFETFASDEMAYKLCWDQFGRFPDTNGIFVTGGGLGGVCQFLKETGRAGSVKVVSTDFVAQTAKWLKDGVVQFIIGQQPYRQGYYPIKLLSDYLLGRGKPRQHNFYTQNDIITSESIESSFLDENGI